MCVFVWNYNGQKKLFLRLRLMFVRNNVLVSFFHHEFHSSLYLSFLVFIYFYRMILDSRKSMHNWREIVKRIDDIWLGSFYLRKHTCCDSMERERFTKSLYLFSVCRRWLKIFNVSTNVWNFYLSQLYIYVQFFNSHISKASLSGWPNVLQCMIYNV
jgi:hypothetical protein